MVFLLIWFRWCNHIWNWNEIAILIAKTSYIGRIILVRMNKNKSSIIELEYVLVQYVSLLFLYIRLVR